MRKRVGERSLQEVLEREERKARKVWIIVLLLVIAAGHSIELVPYLRQSLPVVVSGELGKIIDELIIACEIAVLIFIVEEGVRRAHLKRVELNVLQATLRTLVPNELADELIMIIKEPVYRENLRYYLTFLRLESDDPKSADSFILRRELRYTLVNTTDVPQAHEVRTSGRDEFGTLFSLSPKLSLRDSKSLRVDIDGKRVKISPVFVGGAEAGTISRLLMAALAGLRYGQKPNVIYHQRSKKFELMTDVRIPPRGRVEVYFSIDQVVRLEDRNSVYVQLQPSVNLFVTISNACRERIAGEITADLNHRSKQRFIRENANSYRFEGGILPGQSFDVSWELIGDS